MSNSVEELGLPCCHFCETALPEDSYLMMEGVSDNALRILDYYENRLAYLEPQEIINDALEDANLARLMAQGDDNEAEALESVTQDLRQTWQALWMLVNFGSVEQIKDEFSAKPKVARWFAKAKSGDQIFVCDPHFSRGDRLNQFEQGSVILARTAIENMFKTQILGLEELLNSSSNEPPEQLAA